MKKATRRRITLTAITLLGLYLIYHFGAMLNATTSVGIQISSPLLAILFLVFQYVLLGFGIVCITFVVNNVCKFKKYQQLKGQNTPSFFDFLAKKQYNCFIGFLKSNVKEITLKKLTRWSLRGRFLSIIVVALLAGIIIARDNSIITLQQVFDNLVVSVILCIGAGLCFRQDKKILQS